MCSFLIPPPEVAGSTKDHIQKLAVSSLIHMATNLEGGGRTILQREESNSAVYTFCHLPRFKAILHSSHHHPVGQTKPSLFRISIHHPSS